MIVLLPGGDVLWEISEPPEIAPLRTSIDAFAAALVDAHPCIFSRSPVCDSEDIAALLHMSLDQCRHLLAAYESLTSTNAVWRFGTLGADASDEGGVEPHVDDDIPF